MEPNSVSYFYNLKIQQYNKNNNIINLAFELFSNEVEFNIKVLLLKLVDVTFYLRKI